MSNSKSKAKPVKPLQKEVVSPDKNPDFGKICEIYFNVKTGEFNIMANSEAGIDLIIAGLHNVTGMLHHDLFRAMSAMQKKIRGQRIVIPDGKSVEKFGKKC